MTEVLAAAFDPVFAWPHTYLLQEGGSAVVIDPGRGSRPWLERELAGRGLRLGAVLLTHGHMDHTWEAQPLADHHAAPVLLARAGWGFLERPEEAIPHDFPARHLVGHPRRRPRDLRTAEEPVAVGALTITPIPGPGHSICSVSYLVTGAGARGYLATGDTMLGGGRPGEPIAPTGDVAELGRTVGALRAMLRGEGGPLLLPGHA